MRLGTRRENPWGLNRSPGPHLRCIGKWRGTRQFSQLILYLTVVQPLELFVLVGLRFSFIRLLVRSFIYSFILCSSCLCFMFFCLFVYAQTLTASPIRCFPRSGHDRRLPESRSRFGIIQMRSTSTQNVSRLYVDGSNYLFKIGNFLISLVREFIEASPSSVTHIITDYRIITDI